MSCPLPFYIPRYVGYPDVEMSRSSKSRRDKTEGQEIFNKLANTKSGGLVDEKSLYFGLDLD